MSVVQRVEIVNEQSCLKIDTRKIVRLVNQVLDGENASNRGVTVLMTDDARIRSVHARFLGKDTPTDVIAFNVGSDRPSSIVPRPSEIFPSNYLGDVIVSAETAVRECRHYGCTAGEELRRYVVHGVLHLLGYRDKRPADVKRMRARQERYVAGFGAVRR